MTQNLGAETNRKIEAYPKWSVEIFSICLCPRHCVRLPVSISDFGLSWLIYSPEPPSQNSFSQSKFRPR
jgi:hypothetical protein